MTEKKRNMLIALACLAVFLAVNGLLFLMGHFPVRQAGVPDWTATAGLIAAAFMTFAIYSMLYKDNPLFRAAENLFVGLGLGVSSYMMWFQYLKPDIYDRLISPAFDPTVNVYPPDYVLIIPIVLGVLVLMRVWPRYGWVSRYPIALMIGYGTGFGIQPTFHSLILKQVEGTIVPVQVRAVVWVLCLLFALAAVAGAWYAAKGGRLGLVLKILCGVLVLAYVIARNTPALTRPPAVDEAFRGADILVIMLGVASVLCYFFFSAEHKGAMGAVSKVGIIFLMVAFGASFGYTVMARESLVIGRVQFLLGDWLGVL